MIAIIIMVILLIGFVASKFIARYNDRQARRAEVDGRMNSRDESHFWAVASRVGGYVALFAFVLVVIFSCTFRVGAKQYGVLTTYGHPSGHDYGSGIHLKAPWQNDVKVDGKVKTYGFGGSKEDGYDKSYACIPTVIGNGTPTCVVATVRWQVAEDQASVLYQNYGTGDPTDHFGEAVIRAQVNQVVPIVMRSYNPISQLTVLKGQATGESVENASFAPDYDALSRQALATLQSRVSGEATIQSFAISSAPLDSATQQKLSQFIQEQAKTRTALQAIETNKNVATANRELENSLSRSPGILVSKCLDELSDAITKNYDLPAGFSCFSGGSVVIPATK